MMAMPIRLNDVSEPPEEKTSGNTTSAARGDQPDAVEAQAAARLLLQQFGRGGCGVAHVSRVPNRPIGRTIRISTSST